MSSAIYLLKTQFTHKSGPRTFPTKTTVPGKKTVISVLPNEAAKLLAKLAIGDLVVLIAALAIGILGVLSMTHVLNMPSEMIYAFAGVGLVVIPYAILLIKNISILGLDKGIGSDLKTIPTTIRWACSKNFED